jgi:hypothetical protein
MVCYEKLIFKEIDDLIIDSLESFFVGGLVQFKTALNLTNPLIPKYLIGFATNNRNTRICAYFYLSNYGRKMGSLSLQYRYMLQSRSMH